MDRRQFFKSSALWLAGLLVAPHLKLIAPVESVSPLMLAFFNVWKKIEEMQMYNPASYGIVVHPDLLEEMIDYWHTTELKNSYRIDNPDWTYRIENEH